MKLLKKILDTFNGLHFPLEYLCLDKNSFPDTLHVYRVSGQLILKDITNEHVFAGYCPLIFAFSITHFSRPEEKISIIFTRKAMEANGPFRSRDALARLELEKIHQDASMGVVYYSGLKGKHRFIPVFNQFFLQLSNYLYHREPGNVYLNRNLYKQVQVAYAFPRIIALITLQEEEAYNLFPTDLHGQVETDRYIISLRTGGKAYEQVSRLKKVLISRVSSGACKSAYALGKNHMRDMDKIENLPFSQTRSVLYNWPIPAQAQSYMELDLLSDFSVGIHTLFLFKINRHQAITTQGDVLAHIHNSYATWRYTHKLPGNYLLR
jgi:flavin reductase (DIM6/NTAB) family NADH-FMN oxidoreductase RutF